MTEYPYILFNKSPELTAWAPAAAGPTLATSAPAAPSCGHRPKPCPRAVPLETVAQAIHVLDEQFPWLHGAVKQFSREPE